MKKLSSHPAIRLLVTAICSLLMIVSCDDDKPAILPSVIQFSTNLQNVVEGEEATVVLTLDRPASGTGSVELNLQTNAVYGQHFEADPSVNDNTIVLEVRKGQTSVEFKIATVNNDKYEGTRFIVFQLKPQSDDLKAGEVSALTLTIGDDEGPSVANFAVNSATLNETSENGILVEIPLSAPAKGEGSLTVTVNFGSAIQGTNFTIDQELTNNSFSFNVVKNTAGVKFKIFPIDNEVFTNDFTLLFTITEISGVVQKGNSPSFKLTLEDDELPSLARFAATSGTISETNGDGIVVDILLSTPVKGAGTLGITFPSGNVIYGADFTTLPAATNHRIPLDFSHDQVSASFTVFPVNNDLLNYDRTLGFSITSSTGSVWRGTDSLVYMLTLVDDEEPSVASFALPSATIDERSTEGVEVEVLFSHPTIAPGQIVVDVEGYADNFTSVPALEEIPYSSYSSYSYGYSTYKITLDVPANASGTSFTVLPLLTNFCNTTNITFTINNVSGAIVTDGVPEFNLMIENDDEPLTVITLTEKEGALSENDPGGREIKLNFSKASPREGLILLYSEHYENGRYITVPATRYDYTTDPYNYSFFAVQEFSEGDNSAIFKVNAKNDSAINGDLVETFSLKVYYRGGVKDDGCVSIQDGIYTLTLLDDE